MKEIGKLGAILLLICAIASALLAFVNTKTIDKIVEQRELASELARKEVLPDADKFEKLDDALLKEFSDKNDKVKEIYVGFSGDTVIGYVVKTAPGGYGGAVEVISGISTDNSLTGVRVGNHNETPGLGANALLPSFYEQYNGMSVEGEVGVAKANPQENQIQAIAGATITSQAVTDGVNMAAEVVKELNKK
ncbi:MAG: RnfABCDGE type electron transport complex subunit G [Firmicutes bacterium]|jgi:electron transport complex protein RnfG|nr:RnfABCDGE type electron transport complex subunit G [Bacillota bacterium]